MSNCRGCGKPIEWGVTEKNRKPIPLDVDRVEDGNLIVESQVATPRGMAPLVKHVAAGTGDRVSHWSTCVEAESFRR